MIELLTGIGYSFLVISFIRPVEFWSFYKGLYKKGHYGVLAERGILLFTLYLFAAFMLHSSLKALGLMLILFFIPPVAYSFYIRDKRS